MKQTRKSFFGVIYP